MTHSRREILRISAIGAAGLLPLPTFGSFGGRFAQTDLVGRFLKAAKTGDLGAVKKLLSENSALLAATDSQGRTAFVLAYLNGHRDVGAYLVSQGYLADAHEAALSQDWERFTALTAEDVSTINLDHPIGGTAMYAAAVGGAGADTWRIYNALGDPNTVPRAVDRTSPLQAALRYRDLAIAEITAASMLSNDADPNLAPAAEFPPLHIAAQRGSYEIAEMLVRLGASVSAADRHGRTAQEVAELAGHPDVATLLAKHHSIPRTHSTSRSTYDVHGHAYSAPDISDIPMFERSRFVGKSHFDLEYVTEAFSKEPRLVHSRATTSELSVEACTHTGRKTVVDFLLEHGAPYSLPAAVMRNDATRVKQLLDEDPLRIHERGAHDFALLWYPVIGLCGTAMMETLLARGAKVEEQHFLGTTALHWACMRGPIDVVELLIENGADVNRRGRKFKAVGETPLQLAKAGDQQQIARLLTERGATA